MSPRVGQSDPHGFGRNPEQFGESFDVLDAHSPGLLDEASRHQQAGGEVIGDPLNLTIVLLFVTVAKPGVDDPLGVPGDDVAELMRQGETPTTQASVLVHENLVRPVLPLGKARQSWHLVPGPQDDPHSWHIANPQQVDRTWCVYTPELQQLGGVQLGDGVGITERQRSYRGELAQLRNSRLCWWCVHSLPSFL